MLTVDFQNPLVAQHDPAAPLVLKRHDPFSEVILEMLVELFQVESNRGHLRLGEDDGQRRAAQAGPAIGIAPGILASNAS